MLNIKVTILFRLPGWVIHIVCATFCNIGKRREPDKGQYLKLHEQKNVNGNQQSTDSLFHLQSLKNISYHQKKKKHSFKQSSLLE